MSVNKFKPKSPLMFPVNVQILQKTIDGQIIKVTNVKNRVLKTFGLYSYCRFILGDFTNKNIVDEKQYVPKYLAVGSAAGELNGAPGTDTTVKITDISLYHEITDVDTTGEPIKNNRIKLNRANYIEDIEEQPYLKIQYEAYIPEDRFVGQTIGEMALMTEATGWNAFARITGFDPIYKAENTVIQIIWEITIISVESSVRYIPLVKTYLIEALDKAINVLTEYKDDPEGLTGARVALDKLIEPSKNVDTGMYLLLNDNDQITQDSINNFLSKPFNNVNDTGLVPLIWKFDPNWDVPNHWPIITP